MANTSQLHTPGLFEKSVSRGPHHYKSSSLKKVIKELKAYQEQDDTSALGGQQRRNVMARQEKQMRYLVKALYYWIEYNRREFEDRKPDNTCSLFLGMLKVIETYNWSDFPPLPVWLSGYIGKSERSSNDVNRFVKKSNIYQSDIPKDRTDQQKLMSRFSNTFNNKAMLQDSLEFKYGKKYGRVIVWRGTRTNAPPGYDGAWPLEGAEPLAIFEPSKASIKKAYHLNLWVEDWHKFDLKNQGVRRYQGVTQFKLGPQCVWAYNPLRS